MAEGNPSSSPHRGRIQDARGRKVTQIDPVTMRLLRQHDVIPAETLRKLAEEIGVGWPWLVRVTFFVMLVFLIVLLLAIVTRLVRSVFLGSPQFGAFTEALLYLVPPLAGLFSIWFVSARVRFKRIRNIILKHLRCPHCGYDLRMLPTDPADGATVCPECGCAWRLGQAETAGDRGDG